MVYQKEESIIGEKPDNNDQNLEEKGNILKQLSEKDYDQNFKSGLPTKRAAENKLNLDDLVKEGNVKMPERPETVKTEEVVNENFIAKESP